MPSDKAYRLYVDALLTPGLREDERESVRRYFTSHVHDMEDVISLCAQTLSDLTHYTALVLTPRQSDLRVSSLHLVSVARGSALLIVVTDSGVIRDTTIRVSEKLDSDGLYAISKMLTERLRGLSFARCAKCSTASPHIPMRTRACSRALRSWPGKWKNKPKPTA